MQSKYMSIKEVLETLPVTPQAIYAWLKEGRIEHLKIPGKKRSTWLILRADFNRFIEESTVQRAAPRRVGRPTLLKLEKRA